MRTGEVIAMALIWFVVGGLSSFIFGLWWYHPDQRPIPIRQAVDECDAKDVQVLHMDNSYIATFVVDRGVRCVTIIRGQE